MSVTAIDAGDDMGRGVLDEFELAEDDRAKGEIVRARQMIAQERMASLETRQKAMLFELQTLEKQWKADLEKADEAMKAWMSGIGDKKGVDMNEYTVNLETGHAKKSEHVKAVH